MKIEHFMNLKATKSFGNFVVLKIISSIKSELQTFLKKLWVWVIDNCIDTGAMALLEFFQGNSVIYIISEYI